MKPLILIFLLPLLAIAGTEDTHAEWNRLETELIEFGFKERELANIGLAGLRILHERVCISQELKKLNIEVKWYEKPLEEMRRKLKIEREKRKKDMGKFRANCATI